MHKFYPALYDALLQRVWETGPGVTGALLQDWWRLHPAVVDLWTEEFLGPDLPQPGCGRHAPGLCGPHLLSDPDQRPVDGGSAHEEEQQPQGKGKNSGGLMMWKMGSIKFVLCSLKN